MSCFENYNAFILISFQNTAQYTSHSHCYRIHLYNPLLSLPSHPMSSTFLFLFPENLHSDLTPSLSPFSLTPILLTPPSTSPTQIVRPFLQILFIKEEVFFFQIVNPSLVITFSVFTVRKISSSHSEILFACI